jgi:site-specific recombinase XerD
MGKAEKKAMRNKAILSVLLDTGIRAGELCRLMLEDVCITDKEAYLVVLGKGLKQREVPLGKQSSRLLLEYLESFSSFLIISRQTSPFIRVDMLKHLCYN